MMGEPLTGWRVEDAATGSVTDVRLVPGKRRPGRKPTVRTLHKQLTGEIRRPAPRNSVRLVIDAIETSVQAARATPAPFSERVEQNRELLRKRKAPQATETHPPTGQAALWHDDVILRVPRSGQKVARQVARLCGDDSQVTVPIRSLSDAVGWKDSAGRDSAYARRGIECLTEAGWLSTETTGSGQNVITTFYLQPGDRAVEWFPEDDDLWQEEQLE